MNPTPTWKSFLPHRHLMFYRPLWPHAERVAIMNQSSSPVRIQQLDGTMQDLRAGQRDVKLVIFWLWWVWELPWPLLGRAKCKMRYLPIEQPHSIKEGVWFFQKFLSHSGAIAGHLVQRSEVERQLTAKAGPGELVLLDGVWYWKISSERQ